MEIEKVWRNPWELDREVFRDKIDENSYKVSIWKGVPSEVPQEHIGSNYIFLICKLYARRTE